MNALAKLKPITPKASDKAAQANQKMPSTLTLPA
jgi:hypothetical protein